MTLNRYDLPQALTVLDFDSSLSRPVESQTIRELIRQLSQGLASDVEKWTLPSLLVETVGCAPPKLL